MKTTLNLDHKKQISSSFTFIAKIIIPSVFYGVMLIALYSLIIQQQYLGSLAVLFVLLFFGTLIYLGFVRLMTIEHDSQYFYVSNYIRTIKIPISKLEEVTQLTIPGNYRPIFLHFEKDTYFGKSIMFLDSTESKFSISESPTVEKLRKLI